MLEITKGNLLDADVEALVNSVNTVGVMGKGIALQFKRAFPENFEAYERASKQGEIVIGRVFSFETGRLRPKWILNVPTKRHWRQPSRLDDVRKGLAALAAEIQRLGVRSIAVPPLGCGAGGLSWDVVRPLMERALGTLPTVEVKLFAPGKTPPPKAMQNRTSKPRMTPGRAALLTLAGAYLDGGLDDNLTTLELQKLAYFMQEAGEELRLKYIEHHYGPYADALRKVLDVMEGHYVSGLGDDAARPDAEVELLPGAREEAEALLANAESTKQHIQKVLELIHGFEDSYGLELLATTHWVMRHHPQAANDAEAAIARVLSWNPRKAGVFRPQHIQIAWQRLRDRGWVAAVGAQAESAIGQ